LQFRHLLNYLLLFPLFFQFSCDDAFSTAGNPNCENTDPYCYDLEVETTLAYEVQRPVRLLNGAIWVDGQPATEYYQNEESHIFHIPFERIYEITFERPRGLPVPDAGTGLIPLKMRIKAMPFDETTGDTITLVLPRSRAIMIKGDETQYVQRQLENNRRQFQIKKIVFKGKYLKQQPGAPSRN
jgi:hypothetical protein